MSQCDDLFDHFADDLRGCALLTVYNNIGVTDVVWVSRVDMNNWMRGLRAHFEGARQGPGLRISGATHGWPVLSLTACALSAHAITESGKSDCLWNAGIIAVLKIVIHTPPRCGPERKCCRRFCSNRSRGASRQSRRSAGSSASSHIRPD